MPTTPMPLVQELPFLKWSAAALTKFVKPYTAPTTEAHTLKGIKV
jgi:hypothetical protein